MEYKDEFKAYAWVVANNMIENESRKLKGVYIDRDDFYVADFNDCVVKIPKSVFVGVMKSR